MSLTDFLSERRIWKDPRFPLCINCSVSLPAGLQPYKRRGPALKRNSQGEILQVREDSELH